MVIIPEYLLEQMLAIVFAMIRMVPVFLASSLSPFARFPMIVRITTMLIIGLLALQFTSPQLGALSQLGGIALLKLVSSELVLGLAFAFGLQTAMAALLTFGRVVDMQVGFGAAGILDPNTGSSESVVGMMFLMLASVLVFSTYLHHDLVSLLVVSYQIIPIGQSLFGLNLESLLEVLSLNFLIALIALLPVILSLFLVDVVIAFAAKTMPQVNAYFVGLPIKIGIGIYALSVSVRYMLPSFNNLFNQTKASWQGIVG
jgi:flagellar biosynthetic protein FliR